ncbi:MAG: HNH endonuclease [Candidatus Coprovivens sp.]
MKNAIKKRYMCHRLVAVAFIENPNNLPFVNHIDGIRNNNKVENLEWCTQEQNEQHSINILGKTMKGKTNSKPVYCKELNKNFKSMKQAVEFLGNHACNEGIKKAILANRPYHGYTFSFIERSTTIENTSGEDGSE